VEAAFKTLKGALCAASILAYTRPGEKFIFDTDASNVGIGRVLSQAQDEQGRVIVYNSKTLIRRREITSSPHENNMS
jgi:hypothetical protein